jgi:hypothetical protein
MQRQGTQPRIHGAEAVEENILVTPQSDLNQVPVF